MAIDHSLSPLIDFAQATSYEMTPAGNRLPPVLWTAFIALNKVHGLWRWYRRAEVYSNPDNLAQLLSGHVVNLVLGDVLLLRIAAQCLLVSTRVLECIQQQTLLYRSAQRWVQAIKGHYPRPVKVSWNRQQVAWGSPSFVVGCQENSLLLWHRIERIVNCTASVFFHSFQLSMRIMDVVDAFCLSPYTRNEGINEGFVNIMKWLDHLVENREELLERMVDNQILIERILKGSPITYQQLQSNIIHTLEKTEAVYQNTQAVFNFHNGVLKAFGKRILDGGKSLIMSNR